MLKNDMEGAIFWHSNDFDGEQKQFVIQQLFGAAW
jgi:hypothetical protein